MARLRGQSVCLQIKEWMLYMHRNVDCDENLHPLPHMPPPLHAQLSYLIPTDYLTSGGRE